METGRYVKMPRSTESRHRYVPWGSHEMSQEALAAFGRADALQSALGRRERSPTRTRG